MPGSLLDAGNVEEDFEKVSPLRGSWSNEEERHIHRRLK